MSTDTKSHTESEALFRDPDRPSLHALSYALRHPDTWPKGFVWDYSKCTQCAMGLAHALWNAVPPTTPSTGASVMAREFAMPYVDARSIFLGSGVKAWGWIPKQVQTEGRLWWKKEFLQANHDDVTPEMVADQIDRYLETAE